MQLGVFSLSLAVKDLAVSRDFYEKLGFSPAGGDGERYQIMRNGTTLVGLFQGMFEGNLLTFNPGWDHEQNELEPFTDVRALHATLAEAGIAAVDSNTAEKPSGPAHFMLVDPDGNTILIDQHR